jgi:hypothetical protein
MYRAIRAQRTGSMFVVNTKHRKGKPGLRAVTLLSVKDI